MLAGVVAVVVTTPPVGFFTHWLSLSSSSSLHVGAVVVAGAVAVAEVVAGVLDDVTGVVGTHAPLSIVEPVPQAVVAAGVLAMVL